MTYEKFSTFKKGLILSLLKDAYADEPDMVDAFSGDWEKSDAFLFDNLSFMDSTGFVTVENGIPVGFMSWDPRHVPGYIDIGHNCIIRSRKGRGLGKQQLSYGLEKIKLLGPKRITVKTGNIPFFLPARKMYESQGFVCIGKKENDSILVPEIIEYEIIM